MTMQLGGHDQRVLNQISPQLAPGETVVAIMGRSQTGPSPWLISLIAYLLFLFIKYYAVAVTTQRVFLVRLSIWTGRPKSVDVAYTVASVRLIEYNEGALWGVLRLQTPAGELKLNVPRVARDGADRVATALSPPALSPRPPAAPPPPIG